MYPPDIARQITKGLKKSAQICRCTKPWLHRGIQKTYSFNPFSKKSTLTTDASNLAYLAVLSQNGHPIFFLIRTLNKHKLNYSAIEK